MKCVLIKDNKNYQNNMIQAVSDDAENYRATVSGLTKIEHGTMIIVSFSIASAPSLTPTLNINNLGEYPIIPLHGLTGSFTDNVAIFENIPYILLFGGTDIEATGWLLVDYAKVDSSDIEGVVKIAQGGTGYTSLADTAYTTARYRGSALYSESNIINPTVNGIINWSYA